MSNNELLLALNCGSSSIKFKLFVLEDLKVLVSGSASQLGSKGQKPTLKVVVKGHEDDAVTDEMEEGAEYIEVYKHLIHLIENSSSKQGVLGEKTSADKVIKLVAHRVVHGGDEKEPMAIWPHHEDGLEKLEKLEQFAPLHNHRAMEVVKACLSHLPHSRQILLFDTLFHQSLPPHIYTYPISAPATAPPIPIRKYGAHGLSYASVLTLMAKHLKKPEQDVNIVIAHLGSGASVCAVKNGKSFDTSMGLTPLDGLPGGSRSGSVDPVLVFHHTADASALVDFQGTKLYKGEMLLNKEGGFAALAGTSDFGTITKRAMSSEGEFEKKDRDSSKLTYDLFLDRLINYIAPYIFKILGTPTSSSDEIPTLDGIVLTGGIGEKGVELRRDLAKYMGWLGVEVDDERNKNAGKDDDKSVFEITKDGSKFKMFVCLTDEETQCAIMAKEVA